MVTKQEVMDYYAENRKDSNRGRCPHIVEVAIDYLGTDKDGNIINFASYIDEGDSTVLLTLEEIKNIVRNHIRQSVVDLIKISEI